MSEELRTTRLSLATGVTLKVQLGGKGGAPPIIFLHGFPESHRTWRHQMANLAADHFVIAPDQRGFGGSDKPEAVKAYEAHVIVDDLLALADALGIDAFTLVGHDWGGAIAWLTALRHPNRVPRLAIANAPHPLIFQRSLIDDPAQRAASQYINAFRTAGMERSIQLMGLEAFFEKSFGAHVDPRLISPAERQAYLDDWAKPGALTGMLNWYRASNIEVPAVGETAAMPKRINMPFPRLRQPVLVVWGSKDKALLPIQLEGLDRLVDDLRLVVEPDAGHFIPWEKPEVVTGAIRNFLQET